ncbi:MAG: hypothetical protein LBG67_02065 [Campylobacteraceae bacterium]|jgi:hypothetical protein|nr:hypothetical protein [Campylobacteraceae bacterium]
MQECYQPKNRDESLEILEKLKDTMSEKAYDEIESSIWNFAMEDMFLDEEDINNLIDLIDNNVSKDEIVEKLLKSFREED